MLKRFALLALILPLSAFTPDKSEKMKELEAIKREIEAVNVDKNKIEARISALANDKTKLLAESIDTARRARDLEARITLSTQNLLTLDKNEQQIKKTIAGKNDVVADVLAALQRMGRSPAPALLTSPQDAMQAVRTALMLGAVLPDMRQEVLALQSDLQALIDTRLEAKNERITFESALKLLQDEHFKLEALADARQEMIKNAEKILNVEKSKVNALAAKATSLESFIQSLDVKPEPPPLPTKQEQLASLSNLGRIAPAIPFNDLKGKIPLPVNGKIIKEFGANNAFPALDKGILLESEKRAIVTAPADAWVLYAGNFRSFGQLVILNAGGGYTLVLAGLEKINVDVGQFVLSGEPIGLMGEGENLKTLITLTNDTPHLYLELKKDGVSVNPSQWILRRLDKV